ncbi:MAG: hypothetical protein ACK5RS_04355 [Acidobacteriota bacterium]
MMAKKRITLEQAEGLMALGSAREARQEEQEAGPAASPKEAPLARYPRKKPNEVQVSAYIDKDLHRQIKIALAEEGTNFTALVNDFLKEWLKNR